MKRRRRRREGKERTKDQRPEEEGKRRKREKLNQEQRREDDEKTKGRSEVLNCRFHGRSLQQLHADQRRRPLDKRLSRRRSEGRATAVQL
ncbi:unnamed protein product [Boreogadus saida]